MVFNYFTAVLFVSVVFFAVSAMKPDIEVIDVHFKDIKDCGSYISKLEYVRYLISNHAKSESLHTTLVGLLDLHFEEMDIHQQRRLSDLLVQDTMVSFQREELREFTKFIHERYLTGIQRFKEDTELIISYCYFLKETDTSLQKKRKIAEHTASIVHGYFTSYETYCLTHYDAKDYIHSKHMPDDDNMTHDQQDGEDNAGKKDAKYFYSLMSGSLHAGYKLMEVLSAERPDIGQLMEAYRLFGRNRLKVEKEWNSKGKTLGKDPEILERYGIYIKYVLHNTKMGDKLIKEARSIDEKQKAFGNTATDFDVKTLFQRISQISDPLLILKYDNNEVIIENCNQSFCRIVRYKRFEILEKSRISHNLGLRPILLKQQYSVIEFALMRKEHQIQIDLSKSNLYFNDRNGVMQECACSYSVHEY